MPLRILILITVQSGNMWFLHCTLLFFDVAIKKQSVNVYFNTTPVFHSSQKFPLIFSTILLEPVFNWWQSLRWGQSNDSVVALLHLAVMTEQYSMNKVFSFGLFIFSRLSSCFHVCMYVCVNVLLLYCCTMGPLSSWLLCLYNINLLFFQSFLKFSQNKILKTHLISILPNPEMNSFSRELWFFIGEWCQRLTSGHYLYSLLLMFLCSLMLLADRSKE